MALGLLGLKVGMTQIYDDKGKLAPVTVLEVGPCPILQVRNQERDGYDAVQLGFIDKPRNQAPAIPDRRWRADPGEGRRRAAALHPRIPPGQGERAEGRLCADGRGSL